MIKRLCLFIGLAALGNYAFAQQPDTAAVPGEIPSTNGLRVTGYVDVYYTHDFTAQKTSQERPGFLYNHKRNREVNINLAYVRIGYVNSIVRANLAVQAGTYPQYNYAAEQTLIKHIYEANAGVKLSKKHDLWVDAGIFGSHIGFESAVSKDCWTLTRSLLAENSPYYLAGAKVTYSSDNGRWTLLASVVNGWQRVRRLEGYTGPSISTQLQFRPSESLTFNWSTFLGADRPDSLRQRRFFNNLYAIIKPAGDRFGLILGFDIGTDRMHRRNGFSGQQQGAGSYIWYSPVCIVRLATTSRSWLNGRVEYYDDRHGVIVGSTGTPNGFRTLGYSLGYDYAIMDNALFRLEGKLYQSRDAIFEASRGRSRINTALTTSLAISF